MSWAGKLLGAGSAEGRESCEVSLRADALVAKTEAGREVALPLATLVFVRQGLEGALLAFHTEGTEQPWITTRDPALLAALMEHPAGRPVLGRERALRQRAWLHHAVMPIALLGVLALSGAWFVTGPLVDLALAALPTSMDVQLGELALAGALKELGGSEVKDEKVVAAVETLLAPIRKQALQTHPGFQFRLHVVRNEQVNAFALPGGPLIVTTALLKEAQSAQSVIGVFAHEVAHVTERHGVRALLKQAGVWALAALVLGDVSSVSTLLIQPATALAGLAFSREMELAADRGGVAFLRAAQQDPRGLREFLTRLRAQENDSVELPEFLSTHPVTDDRIRALDALVGSPAKPALVQNTSVDFQKLQAALTE